MTQHTDQRGGRAILLLIAGLPVTMILAATWLWYFVERGDIDIVGALGTANSGEILSNPVNIRTGRLPPVTEARPVSMRWSQSGRSWSSILARPVMPHVASCST